MPFQPDQTFLKYLTGSAFLSVAVPLVIFVGARLTHTGEQQEQQDEQQNNYDQQQYYDNSYRKCSWWQWGCRDNYQYNNEGGGSRDDERENALPWWWPWSEDERRRDPEDAANPTLVVIYVWTLLLMVGIGYYAYMTVKEYRDLMGLAVAFAALVNFAVVSMLYLGGLEGAVQDDGRVIEEVGFYGQFGVLLFLTNFCVAVFGVVWLFLTRSMMRDQATTKVTVAPEDYLKADDVELPQRTSDAMT